MAFALTGRSARRYCPAVAVALAVLMGGNAARAGAFNIPEGQGLAIFDFTFAGGDRYFNGLGKLAPANAFERGDISAYAEYGVTDWLMAVVRPDVTLISLKGEPSGRYTGLGTTEGGAQLRLLAFGPAVLAVQGTFRLPGSTDRGNPALIGQTSHDADLRGLFGYGFDVNGWPAFLDLQGAYRFRDSDAPDEAHTDLTLGVRPWTDLMVLLQAFNTTGVGRGTPWFPRERYTHVELSGLYDLDPSWSVQLGAYTTVLARDSLRDQGVVTAVWRRF
jgi:protein XagA